MRPTWCRGAHRLTTAAPPAKADHHDDHRHHSAAGGQRLRPPVPARRGRRAHGPRTPLLHGPLHARRRRRGRADRGVRPAGELAVAAARCRPRRRRLRTDRVARARHRPPPGVPRQARVRARRPDHGQPRHRHVLRVVAGQAHPPPRQPQPRGARPGRRPRRARLDARAGFREPRGHPVRQPPPGPAVLPTAHPRRPRPAQVQRAGPHGRARRPGAAAVAGVRTARRARRRLPRRAVPRAAAGARAGVLRDPPGPVRRLPRLDLRTQPQGDGDAAGEARLPAQAGAHFPWAAADSPTVCCTWRWAG